MTTRKLLLVSVAALTFVAAAPAWTRAGDDPEAPAASKVDSDARRTGHVETPRDKELPPPPQPRQARPGMRTSRDGFVSVQVNVDAFGNNIVGDAANEPSLAVDPTDSTRIVIGWRQFDNVASDFRQAGWGYSADGGNTWTFPGVIEPGVFRSDPVVDADAEGNFYYNSLTADGGTTNFRCHIYKSVDGGATWDAGTYAYGGDKQWQVIDTTSGIGHGNIYATWNGFYSACSGNFTRSYDNGQSFLPCTTVLGDPYWGTLAVGPDGELYVSGTGMTIAKSSTMQDSGQAPAWDFSHSVDLDGSLEFSTGPNPAGLLGQNWIGVDRSNGPTRGNVYMLASVSRNSTPDPLDVMFSRSTDGGVTWSPPVRVNDDPGTSAWQWLGTMSVAPNGRIDAVWLDTRNDPGGYDSELYYSYSTDAGVTWAPNVALSPPFDPLIGWPQQQKMGDYFDMTSDDLGADLAYAATFNGEEDVYFLRIGDPACPDAGRVWLDRPTYSCSGVAGVSLIDCGLNTDDNVAESTVVQIASDSEPSGESVTLLENHPASALFEGTIQLGATDAAGVLLVSDGDTVTVTYVDADDGAGGTNVPVTAQATIDCRPPVITNVQASEVTGSSARITWDTDEPADSSVSHGLSLPPSTTDSDAGLVTAHDVRLHGLAECSTHYYSVASTDAVGNAATDDAMGAYYSFETGRNNIPEIPSQDTPVAITDNATVTSTIPVTQGRTVTDVDVIVDITHTYDGDLALTLIPPVGSPILLSNRRGGGGANFSGTRFDDEAATPIASGSAPFAGSYQPDSPLSAADGIDANGDWTLEVSDNAGGDTGTLNSWTLVLTYPPQSCGPHASVGGNETLADVCSSGDGGGNGTWEPGEQVQFRLTVDNDGTDALTGISAVVTPVTPGVLMLDGLAAFPDAPEGSSVDSTSPYFTAQLPLGLVCGGTVQFDVQVHANEGNWSGSFSHGIGQVVSGAGTALTEAFEGGLPGDWTVVDGSGDGNTWVIDNASDPNGCGNTDPNPPLAGNWMAADSDCAGSGVNMDEQLISPVIDLSGATTVAVEFDHYFHFYSGGGAEKADVDVRSSLTGGTWVTLRQWAGADTANPEHATIDATAQAAGANDVQVRWHYYDATFDWFWYVDNVAVTYTVPASCNSTACSASGTGPAPVPDGRLGTEPLRVGRIDASGTQLELSWDDRCATADVNLVYGPLSSVSAYGVSGAECAVGNPETWDPAPAGDLWFLLVGSDGAGTESSWGPGSAGERNGASASGTCGSTVKDVSTTCP